MGSNDELVFTDHRDSAVVGYCFWNVNMKYTPWFHPTETPERVGVYQRVRWGEDDPFFSYWDGRQWWPSGVTPDGALQGYTWYLSYGVPRWVSQILQWRGILK